MKEYEVTFYVNDDMDKVGVVLIEKTYVSAWSDIEGAEHIENTTRVNVPSEFNEVETKELESAFGGLIHIDVIKETFNLRELQP